MSDAYGNGTKISEYQKESASRPVRYFQKEIQTVNRLREGY